MPHVVEGVRLPDRLAGHPGLDLCNTRANWPGPAEHEYLTSARVVAVWAVDGALLPPSLLPIALSTALSTTLSTALSTARSTAPGRSDADPPSPDPVVRQAISLRQALYRCALDVPGAQATSQDWDAVAGAVAAAREVAVLRRPSPSAPASWTLDPDALVAARTADDVARLGLHAAALAADDLLRTARPGDVHACPGAGCGWLFLDPSHRRRWCTMAVCGNRTKARRHAARARAIPG